MRYLHLILMSSLNEHGQRARYYPSSKDEGVEPVDGEYFDRQTYIQIVKTIKTVIQVTPYHLMKRGLAIVIISQLIYNLSMLDKMNNRD